MNLVNLLNWSFGKMIFLRMASWELAYSKLALRGMSFYWLVIHWNGFHWLDFYPFPLSPLEFSGILYSTPPSLLPWAPYEFPTSSGSQGYRFTLRALNGKSLGGRGNIQVVSLGPLVCQKPRVLKGSNMVWYGYGILVPFLALPWETLNYRTESP